MRMKLFIVASLAVFVFFNFSVWRKEQLLARGAGVLLELAPVDPRSLMQGDYMLLRYRLADDPRVLEATRAAGADGKLVVRRNANNGVADFVRVHGGETLAPGEQLLRYRRRANGVRVATESFFFEEGRADVYAEARYGELRVSADGEALLVGLRGERFEPLGDR